MTDEKIDAILEKLEALEKSGKTAEFKYSTNMKAERKISRVDYENDTISIMVTMKYDDPEEEPGWDDMEGDLTEFVDKWEEKMRSRATRSSSRSKYGKKKSSKFGGFKKGE